MMVRKAIAVAASLLVIVSTLFGGTAGAVAGEWTDRNHEHIPGTPEGVSLWAENCYVQDVEPQPGHWNGEITHPGRFYGCNFAIEVTSQYEREHGPYVVPMSLLVATSTFRELGAPYAGVDPPECEPGETPHYVGIASAGEAGAYGADTGGFHVNFFDAACMATNQYPPDPEPPIKPKPQPEPKPTTPPAVVAEVPVPETLPSAPIPSESPIATRAVPELVRTGVGPDIAIVGTSVAPTIKAPLAMRRHEYRWTEPVAQPTSEVPPTLALPAPRAMPFSEELEPATFEDLWVIDDPANGYAANGPRYFLAHTHTQGGAIGNAVNEAGLSRGAAVEIANVRYNVTAVSTIAKPDIGSLPIWQSNDPDDAFLIVCLWNNGSLATHNLVIEMHRA
ncbi:hypothetical protein [Microbacterium capsulatum]|uniref:Uncharacterized protein n=1 Tax=Microbacterium capsulatum TaxID=3041921 RepID=A0ABU0XG27_9MICO|nr:hypothetical protein [Microbacterium sp. ASV81]MDQ4214062.1 hypothetical protein [Microbacterium sp. ASV81]